MNEREHLDPKRMNTTALAFLGDAVYELYIRDLLLTYGMTDADQLHRACVRYVRAESQAAVIRRMMEDFLDEEELALVKRARNHKSGARSRSAGVVDYRLATAFEALVGWHYMVGNGERLEEIMGRAASLIAAGRSEHEQG